MRRTRIINVLYIKLKRDTPYLENICVVSFVTTEYNDNTYAGKKKNKTHKNRKYAKY